MSVVPAVGRRMGDTCVAMRGVAPSEESLAVHASVLYAAEAGREGKAGLDGFELWLRIRVVVAEVRHAVALGE